LTITVLGYASTTGTERANRDYYSQKRAEWAKAVLARALAVPENTVRLGARGSYTAPESERKQPGGVPDPNERRVEIIFAETAPTTPVSATATSTASATATTGH
jgi:outer membrane protein OmpA-like peptidoglycan-associated protein